MSLPDLIEIVPLAHTVKAEITVPGSKSITNRALILAALADGEVRLEGALWSEDTQIMVDCLQELGFMVDVRPDPNEDCNRTITVYGKGGDVPPGGTEQQPMELFVGNAGTAARFLAAFVCLGKGVYRLHGVPRMHERPQAALFNALRELGYRVEAEQGNERLPARIGKAESEKSEIGKQDSALRRSCTVSIVQSSQFASALLLCSKAGNWDVNVVGENAEESPYVVMTAKLMEAFPHCGGRFQIEPDASSGSYFWAAGFRCFSEYLEEVSKTGRLHRTWFGDQSVKVAGWPTSSWQIDSRFPEVFCIVTAFSPNFEVEPKGAEGKRAELRMEVTLSVSEAAEHMAGHFGGYTEALKKLVLRETMSRQSDLGDSIMTAIALSPLAVRPIRFTDLGRLRVQECERVVGLRTELTKCGAKVIEEGDTLTVYPSQLHGAEIETYNDHRMAMCFAILGLKVPGIRIKNPACVKKTFPNFFQKLAAAPPKGLGATILDVKTGRALTHEELFAD